MFPGSTACMGDLSKLLILMNTLLTKRQSSNMKQAQIVISGMNFHIFPCRIEAMKIGALSGWL